MMAGNSNRSKGGLFHIPVDRLRLDPENPRMSQSARADDQEQLLAVLFRDFGLDELADSMRTNGYFAEEPLVAIPLPKKGKKKAIADLSADAYKTWIQNDAEFVVVEGNRRLATVKLLLDSTLRSTVGAKRWQAPSDDVAESLRVLPVIVYPSRTEVITYIGVRHIVGVLKWESYARAQYIAQLVEEGGDSLDRIQVSIGDKRNSARKTYICYRIIEQAAEEFDDIDVAPAKNNFSYLLLATGQGNIRRFLGLPKWADTDPVTPVPTDHLGHLKELLSWMFGEGEKKKVIDESRDITKMLSHVLGSEEALEYLREHRDLDQAYDRTDGEEEMLVKYLGQAHSKLRTCLGILPSHKTESVRLTVVELDATLTAIKELLGITVD